MLQALALHTALSVFLNPGANLPALGIPNDPTNTLNLFIVICLLWAVVKIPGLMRRYVTKGSGGGSIRRVVILPPPTPAPTPPIPNSPAPPPPPPGRRPARRGRGGRGGGPQQRPPPP